MVRGGRKHLVIVAANQKTTDKECNSERASQIPNSNTTFTAKELCPYSVVDNYGFNTMLCPLEPRDNVLSQRNFTDIVIPTSYNQNLTWTSKTTGSCVTVIWHFITSDWQRVSWAPNKNII